MNLTAAQRRRTIAHGKPVAPKVKLPRGMNGLERDYRDHLEMLSLLSEIDDFQAQPEPLELADRCTYRPDFAVYLLDGSVRYDEVKGFEREDSTLKFKFAAKLFPQFGFRMVKRVRGQWKVTREYRNGKPVKGGSRGA